MISSATLALTAIAAVLMVYAFLVFVASHVLDLTWLPLVLLAFALRGMNLFCEGALERIRQLSQLV